MDGIAGKGVQRFAISDGERQVLVLHTHVQAQYPGRGNGYEELRRAQIGELLAQAREPFRGEMVLVAGDFNVREDEAATYASLTAELDDLTAGYRHACGGCGTFDSRDGSETWWIDYVLARRGGSARLVRVDRIRNRARDDPYSDHHGVWVELALGRGSTPPAPMGRPAVALPWAGR
jgi:endonuclease/exonuclease/phosphatase family metal-dependent hydrolase